MAGAGKITKFCEHVDGPLPIRWTPLAEPPRKKPKRGPGRPRKVQQPIVVIDDDGDSEQSESPQRNGHGHCLLPAQH